MLILLPPSESKANARRGRPVDPNSWSFPALAEPRAQVADALRTASAAPDATTTLGVSPGLLADVARNLALDSAPATPAAQVYTGVLYDALDLASMPTAARRRANRWLLVVSALYGAVRPTDRITAYRLAMGVDLPGIGPLARHWRPALSAELPGLAGRGVVVDCRSAPYAAAWPTDPTLASRWVQIRVPGASHNAKHTRGLVARQICLDGADPRSVPALAEALSASFTVELHTPPRPTAAWVLDVKP